MSFILNKDYQKGMDLFNEGCAEYVSCHTKRSHFITILKDKPKKSESKLLFYLEEFSLSVLLLNIKQKMNFK